MRCSPVQPSFGAQMKLRRRQEVFGSVCGVNRRPASSTPTRYPFSVRRSAVTLPPNPEPMTRTS